MKQLSRQIMISKTLGQKKEFIAENFIDFQVNQSEKVSGGNSYFVLLQARSRTGVWCRHTEESR